MYDNPFFQMQNVANKLMQMPKLMRSNRAEFAKTAEIVQVCIDSWLFFTEDSLEMFAVAFVLHKMEQDLYHAFETARKSEGGHEFDAARIPNWYKEKELLQKMSTAAT